MREGTEVVMPRPNRAVWKTSDWSHIEVLITPILARSPFKASATVILGSVYSINGFRIEDRGDGNPTVVFTRPTLDGRREVVGPVKVLRKYESVVLAAYRSGGGEEPTTSPVPLATKPPSLSGHAARPLHDQPTA